MNKDAIPGRVSTDEVDTVALAASLLFMHGQTTERTVVAAQQLGRALGVPVRVLPHWDELVVELDHTSFSEIVPAAPLGVDMGKVLAVQTIVHQVCDGAVPSAAARPALVTAGGMPPVAILRFTVFAAIGAASLGVIYGVCDVASLALIAGSADAGALVRRWQGKLGGNPFLEPLSAATIAGLIGAIASRLHLSDAHRDSGVLRLSASRPDRHTDRRSPAPPLCRRRLFCGRLDDAGHLPVPCRKRAA
jgi:uncharacterized membrane protein YjjP (DUF1212 family)